MNCINCFDIVSEVVEEASSQFGSTWSVNQERFDILEQYCSLLDNIAEESNGESFEVEVDDITMEISISVECNDIIIRNVDSVYLDLFQRAISIEFYAASNGNVVMKLKFPSVWEKA